jgi:hypothetical protein
VDETRVPSGQLADVRTAARERVAAHRLAPGPLTAELWVDGLPVGDLPAGTRLRIGESAVVALAPAPAAAPAGGVVEAPGSEPVPAEVLEAGLVRAGDPVTLEAVAIPLADVLDLHPFRPGETRDVVTAYLAEARAAGLREVRIVHGRGRGVQRALVQGVLAQAPEVAAFADAPPERGGWGATIVRLRDDGAPRCG